MDGKEFSEWLDTRSITPAQAAGLFGSSEQNIYNWRSTRGVPASKADWVRKVMAEHDANQTVDLPNRLILEPSRSQFRTWNRAALMAGQLIDDWAAGALDDAAAEDEANQTGSDSPSNPLKSPPDLKVAEDSTDYLPKKGNGA